MSDCDYLEGWNNGEAHATSNHAGWPRPIPVGERLPAESIDPDIDDGYCDDVLILTCLGCENSDGSESREWLIGNHKAGEWRAVTLIGYYDCKPTHWLPLPPKP